MNRNEQIKNCTKKIKVETAGVGGEIQSVPYRQDSE